MAGGWQTRASRRRNRLAHWLAARRRRHIALSGTPAIARALGLIPDVEPPPRRGHRQRSPVQEQSGQPVFSAPYREWSASRTESALDPADAVSDPDDVIADPVEVDVTTHVDAPDQPLAVGAETVPDTSAALADLPGLRALMSTIFPPTPTAPRAASPQRGPEPTARRIEPAAPTPAPGVTPEASTADPDPRSVVPPTAFEAAVEADEEPWGDMPAPSIEQVDLAAGPASVAGPEPADEAVETPAASRSSGERQTPPSDRTALPAEPAHTSAERPVARIVSEPDPDTTPPVAAQDRSPQAWLERLRDAARPDAGGERPVERTPSPEVAVPAGYSPGSGELPAPEPMPLPARRFLKPLTGVDPSTVRIYRERPANPIVSSRQADAVTIGEDVVVAAGQQLSTPEGLGLLAHELTHVAQRRAPRFVPPLVRHLSGIEHDDEESVARRVEARVARVTRPDPASTAGTPVRHVAEPILRPPGFVAATERPAPSSQGGEPGAHTAAFGGLPAPWEPLPDWPAPTVDVTQASSSLTVAADMPLSRVSAPASVAASSNGSGAYAAPEVRHADAGRTVEDAPAVPPASDKPAAVEPDLDALAKQVYAVLRRRLLAEQRRAG